MSIEDSDDCRNLGRFLKDPPNFKCCNDKNIKCDTAGNIVDLKLTDNDIISTNLDDIDFTRFPVFQKLINLNVGTTKLFPQNVLPSRFFEQPKLDILVIHSSSISIIPTIFNYKSPVSEINLEHNKLTQFPSQFKNLPNLQHLYLWDNKISGEVDLSGFEKLDQLDIGKNEISDVKNIPKQMNMLFLFENKDIKKVPDGVTDLADLIHLNLNETGITELPPNLFKLCRLNFFEIGGNPQLTTKIINFGNKNIKECNFKGTNIECYQEGTCESIDVDGIAPCSEKDIKSIKDAQTVNIINKDIVEGINTNNIPSIIIGVIAFLLILALMVFIFVRKYNKIKSKKNDEFSGGEQYDIVVKERIKKIKIEDDFKDDFKEDLKNDIKNEILKDLNISKVINPELNNISANNFKVSFNCTQNENQSNNISQSNSIQKKNSHRSQIFNAEAVDTTNDVSYNNNNNKNNNNNNNNNNNSDESDVYLPINDLNNHPPDNVPAYTEIDINNLGSSSSSSSQNDERNLDRLPSYKSLPDKEKPNDTKQPLN